MSRTKKAGAVLATLIGAVVLFAIPAAASQPGQTVKVNSTLQISAYGYFGKVKSPNSNCLAERTAGPIYKCLGATSKTITINGG